MSFYSEEMNNALTKIKDSTKRNITCALWQEAISSKWQKNPVWVHGDFATGNMLVKDGALHAVIDFGCLAIGDPACDLAIAWNLLDTSSRAVFKKTMAIDDATWIRGMGWTLWKTLCWPIDGTPVKHILNELYIDYKEQIND